MPRYFFHTNDEDGSADDTSGVECLNDEAAREAAIHAFGEMLMHADEKARPVSWAMLVVRENGGPVCRLSLRVSDPH